MSAGDASGLSLADGMDLSGMTFDQLWLRQVSIGGDMSAMELEAYVLGLLRLDAHHHNVIAQALNEHFLDRGERHPVGYALVTRSARGGYPGHG